MARLRRAPSKPRMGTIKVSLSFLASQLSSDIKRLALDVGFDLAGIAGVADTPEHRFFPDWLNAGYGGEMRYLEARNDAGKLKRASLANAAPWARSVVVCALNYNTDAPYSTHSGSTSQGWISRYAWTERDYHDVLLVKLRALEAEAEWTWSRSKVTRSRAPGATSIPAR